MKAACKAAAGLEVHYEEVVSVGMEGTPTLRTIGSETKKGLLQRIDVRWTKFVLCCLLNICSYISF